MAATRRGAQRLAPGEQVLVEIRPHWMYLIGPLATSVAVVAVAVSLDVGIFPHSSVDIHWVEGIAAALPCAWLVARFVRWRQASLVLTSLRIIERHGVVHRGGTEIPLAHIEHVDAFQSFFRRLVGAGSLEVTVWGNDEVFVFDDVRKPVILQRVIDRRLPPPPGSEGGAPGFDR